MEWLYLGLDRVWVVLNELIRRYKVVMNRIEVEGRRTRFMYLYDAGAINLVTAGTTNATRHWRCCDCL